MEKSVKKLTYWDYTPTKVEKVSIDLTVLTQTELIGPPREKNRRMFSKEPHTIFKSDDTTVIVSDQDIINIEYEQI